MYVYVYVFVYVYVCVIQKVVRVRQNCWDWKDGERTVRRAKSGETLVEASRDTNAQIVRYTFFMGAKDKSNHPVADSLRSVPQDEWS